MAKILVIDDNPDLLQMMQMMLSGRGKHEVILSGDGMDGLEKAFRERPDLGIVDVMMPEMNGYEVVRQLRNDPRTKTMKIIILTARGQPIDRMAALDAGADEHMSKPVKMNELLEKIEALLGPQRITGQSHLIAVLSLRGGIGVSTIAVNLALLLQSAMPTVLVDLSPNAGHCALYLGLKPERHWDHFLKAPTVSPEVFLIKHPNGLQIMAAPPTPLVNTVITSAELQPLLQGLSAHARALVIDLPHILNETTLTCLEQASTILLVTGDDPASLQTTLTTLGVLQKYLPRIAIVVNAPVPGPRPPTEALQRMIRLPIIANLPYDHQQVTALRRNMPIVMVAPQGELSKGLQGLAQALLTPSKA